MKILLTSDWYTPAINGVVTSVLNLKQGLEARGHEVRVLTLSQTHRSYTEGDVTYIGSRTANRIYPGVRMRTSFRWKWVKELIAWRPDIIHSNCEFFTFFIAHHLAEELQVPLLHTYHTVYEDYTHYFCPSESGGKRLVRQFSRWVSRRTNGMIAPTEKVAGMLRGYGITQPIYVIPTGIDLGRFQEEPDPEELRVLRESLGIPADHTLLVSIGRLAREKNTEELLEAMTAFRGEKVKLLIVGDGPYREELEELTDALNLRGQVIFAGMVPPESVGKYYHLGDLFVCASTSETQGLTYMEALAAGLPMLCRADECLEGVVLRGENGWQYESVEEFREKLRLFLEHPELRVKLHENAVKTGEQFSIAAFAERAEGAYIEQLKLWKEKSV